MKPFFTLPILVLFIVSCQDPAHPSVTLTETSMYSIDTVRLAAGSGDEKAATKKWQEAASLLKKGGDTAGSIALFKTAIRLNPTPKSYFDLGGALITARYYAEALRALNIARRLDYTPTANLMARYALVYSNLDGGPNGDASDSALHYMELAIQMGYAHPREFMKKDLFPTLSGNMKFDAIYASVVSGGRGTDADKGLWDGFENQFTEMTLPLAIDRKWIRAHGFGDAISPQYEKFIPEMRDAHFAREESYDYFYVGLIHRDAQYVALLYCMKMSSADADSAQVYTLVSYDHQGKIVDLLPVAGQKSQAANFSTFSIRPDLQFQVQEFATIYKQDPVSAGYDSTNISGEKPLEPKQYRISNAGKFLPAGNPLAAR